VLITGSDELAIALQKVFSDHNVVLVSRKSGHDINCVDQWGGVFTNHDMAINCAYSDHGQLKVLDYFFNCWKNDPAKKIITIGSRVISHRPVATSFDYWPYKLHKQQLQLAHDAMLSEAVCDMKIINPGPIDTKMVRHHAVPKFSTEEFATKVKEIANDRSLKRVDLWV
jgi:hypothetical protein